MKVQEILCLRCRRWFRSPIQVGNGTELDARGIVGNKAQCSHCGKRTGVDEKNMRVIEERGER